MKRKVNIAYKRNNNNYGMMQEAEKIISEPHLGCTLRVSHKS
jgi:hypothetical protein